ncbi:DUF2690 domain-containing protein [Kitasatospora sp. NPDC004240]
MAPAWKQLPEELPEPVRRLTVELRAVKDATGLSLSELASRTHYSRASWERWLNGKRIVTEQALDALIATVDCDGPALRSLWTAATTEPAAPAGVASGTGGAEAAAAEPAPAEAVLPEVVAPERAAGEEAADEVVTRERADAPEPVASALRRRPVALLSCAAVAVVILLVLAGLRFSGDGKKDAAAAARPVPPAGAPSSPAKPGTPSSPAPAAPGCQAVGCSHKDPKLTGCGADARTMQTINIGKVVAYLRYSQRCQAAWAAVTEGQPGDKAIITTSTGESAEALIHWGYDNYSPMVNAADPTTTFQVCGYQQAGEACTVSAADLANSVASTPIPVGPPKPPTPPATPDPSATLPAPSATPAAPAPGPSAS